VAFRAPANGARAPALSFPMLLRLLYDDALAAASYLIGCQKTGEAIIIDPQRDVDRYIEAAKREGLRLVASAETHIHADFLSGARELAEKGVKAYLSAEGGPDWQYQWPGPYKHQLLRNNDTFSIGNIHFRVLHTPGHTPEHICFEVTDQGGGAGGGAEPMGILTGDFVFVGDLGRPDLLETAAGQSGAKEVGARQLFGSVKQFLKLPEYLQVWPAHGAGSACGKALGAVPQSTVGYERRHNAAIQSAIRNPQSAIEFTDFILAGQPEPPTYFARMKRQNRDGPPVLGTLPKPMTLTAADVAKLDFKQIAILDTRPWTDFKAGHLPGSLRDPLDRTFNTIAGAYSRENQDIYIVATAAQTDEAVRALVRVGLDRIKGLIEPAAIAAHAAHGGKLETTPEVGLKGANDLIASGALVLDVRRKSDEFDAGHIPGALNIPHLRLSAHLSDLPRGRKILVSCKTGSRSSRAATLLQREGFDATNFEGGFDAWAAAHQPIER
jgi:hydroxyacylglutathione hydrolase